MSIFRSFFFLFLLFKEVFVKKFTPKAALAPLRSTHSFFFLIEGALVIRDAKQPHLKRIEQKKGVNKYKTPIEPWPNQSMTKKVRYEKKTKQNKKTQKERI